MESQNSSSSLSGETRTIAIAVDPTEFSEYAFDWYLKFLHHPAYRVVAIHVPEAFNMEKAQKEIAKGGQMKQSLERQYSKITELEERFQHKMHSAQVKGSVLSVPSKTPGQTIIEMAKEEGAFAIVMGTRGRSKIKKAILGSVSDYVIQNADIPTIVVRKNEVADAHHKK